MSEWILINEIPSLDLSQISHCCCALMRDMAEIQFRDLIIKIRSLTGFCLKHTASLGAVGSSHIRSTDWRLTVKDWRLTFLSDR